MLCVSPRQRHRIERAVIEASGPRLHCGQTSLGVVECGGQVIEASGPRLHCGGSKGAQRGGCSASDRGLRASTSLRRAGVGVVGAHADGDRGLRASTSLRPPRLGQRRRSRHRVIEASGPRLHCGHDRAARRSGSHGVIEASGPRLHCGPANRNKHASVTSGDRGLRASTSLRPRLADHRHGTRRM